MCAVTTQRKSGPWREPPNLALRRLPAAATDTDQGDGRGDERAADKDDECGGGAAAAPTRVYREDQGNDESGPRDSGDEEMRSTADLGRGNPGRGHDDPDERPAEDGDRRCEERGSARDQASDPSDADEHTGDGQAGHRAGVQIPPERWVTMPVAKRRPRVHPDRITTGRRAEVMIRAGRNPAGLGAAGLTLNVYADVIPDDTAARSTCSARRCGEHETSRCPDRELSVRRLRRRWRPQSPSSTISSRVPPGPRATLVTAEPAVLHACRVRLVAVWIACAARVRQSSRARGSTAARQAPFPAMRLMSCRRTARRALFAWCRSHEIACWQIRSAGGIFGSSWARSQRCNTAPELGRKRE
jgi:hypothetical protein